jgi:hemoglobin-like flavoprotein
LHGGEFDIKVGGLTMLKLFELEPATKKIFGFSKDTVLTAQELEKTGAIIHAVRMIHMIDAALSMLGTDLELLNEIMLDLGKRHMGYGVSADHFPAMGNALVFAMSKVLGSTWNQMTENAWLEAYGEFSSDMAASLLEN